MAEACPSGADVGNLVEAVLWCRGHAWNLALPGKPAPPQADSMNGRTFKPVIVLESWEEESSPRS